MNTVFTDEVLAMMDKTFQENPELPFKFPSFRRAFDTRLEEAIKQVQEQISRQAQEQVSRQVQEQVSRQVQEQVKQRILQLVNLKFDVVPEEMERRIQATNDLRILDQWFDRIFKARSVDELDLSETA